MSEIHVCDATGCTVVYEDLVNSAPPAVYLCECDQPGAGCRTCIRIQNDYATPPGTCTMTGRKWHHRDGGATWVHLGDVTDEDEARDELEHAMERDD